MYSCIHSRVDIMLLFVHSFVMALARICHLHKVQSKISAQAINHSVLEHIWITDDEWTCETDDHKLLSYCRMK
jgi:hypothetical protein